MILLDLGFRFGTVRGEVGGRGRTHSDWRGTGVGDWRGTGVGSSRRCATGDIAGLICYNCGIRFHR